MIILEEEVAATTKAHRGALIPTPPVGIKDPFGLDDTATVGNCEFEVGQASS